MLQLDDPAWAKLEDSFGPATTIPDLLRRVRDEDEPPWDDMCTRLCHQGETYSATFAAVPHVVAFARARPAEDRLEDLVFVAHVEKDRATRPDTVMPGFLAADYHAALDDARRLVTETLFAFAWDESETPYLLFVAAVLMGQPRVAHAVEGIVDLNCPECDADLCDSEE